MYQALYRKWRPRIFEDVVGQPHITKTLKNELTSGTVAHAYLFTGSRGTGKTTCAKIMAKAVNCLNLQAGDPCNECANCRGIDSGAIMDVVEIDAASNNGVDDIRDLREETVYSPATAKYRVYIIDEAHMLSGGAFNALLKTLEEPPEYVIFILATTEPHKVPATILSRCQRFDFRRIPAGEIAARLSYVAGEEHIELSDGAAALIARLADGGMRDALSLLDKCAGSGGPVDVEAVSGAAGLSGREYLFELADAVRSGDYSSALIVLDGLYAQSKDMERLCEELINHFRGIMLLKSAKEAADILNSQPEEAERLRDQAAGLSAEAVLHALDTLQHTLETLRRSVSRRVEMEMCLLRLCRPELDGSNVSLLRRVAALEDKLGQGFTAAAVKPPEPEQEKSAPARSRPAAPAAKPAQVAEKTEAQAAEEPLACWPEVLESLASLDAPLKGVLNGSAAFLRGEHVLVDASNAMFADLIRKSEHQKPLLEAVRRITGKPYKVGIFMRSFKLKEPENDVMDEIASKAKSQGINVIER